MLVAHVKEHKAIAARIVEVIVILGRGVVLHAQRVHLVRQYREFALIGGVADYVVVIAYAAVHRHAQAVQRVHYFLMLGAHDVHVGIVIVADVAARHDERYTGAAVEYVLHRIRSVCSQLIL